MALLDDLIERYGIDAVISVDPYMPDSSGDILRRVTQIDGDEVDTADIRIVERDGRTVMLLTDGNEEIELTSWREGGYGPPPRAGQVPVHPRRLAASKLECGSAGGALGRA